jgi:hypothetical protein
MSDEKPQHPNEVEEAGQGNTLPVPVPDADLTISADRLAGSVQCLNCGTVLQGPFCHYCGQPDRNFMRFFPVLLRELLEDFLDFDSRFMRTMKPLLFKPGKLTRDYLDGRRFRYTPPLRLYLFSSIACFFLAAVAASDSLEINTDGDVVLAGSGIAQLDDPEIQQALERMDPEKRQRVEEALQQVAKAKEEVEAEAEAEEEEEEGDGTIMIGDKPWDRETNPFIIEWMPDWVNDWVNDEIEQSPEKGKQIEENPDLIKDKVFDVLPATMFVLLPIVALLFKFWYLFAKKYYIEHLIFALHNHSFAFVMIVILILFSTLGAWIEPDGEGRFSTFTGWIFTAIGIWIPVYFLISLKRVYQQGWGMTVAKYCLIGISYLVLLGFATAFIALLSFVLL